MNNDNNQTIDLIPGFSIHAIVKDGKSWFRAKEVCTALGLANVSQALEDSVDPEHRAKINLGLPGRASLVVSELGLYSLIMRSRKTAAKQFQKWVIGSVLPTLLKDGVYISGQENRFSGDLTLCALLAEMAEIQSKVDAIKEAKLHEWSRHQENKNVLRDALPIPQMELRCEASPYGPSKGSTVAIEHSSR